LNNSNKFYPEEYIAMLTAFAVILVQVYCIFSGILTNISILTIPVLSFVLLTLIIIVQKNREPLKEPISDKHKTFRFLRGWLQIPFYGIIFTAFQSFVHKLNPTDYDWLLLKADYNTFGFDITVWLEKYISNTLTEILTLSYFSYYVLPSLTFIILFWSKDKAAFVNARKYLLAIVIGWYGAFIFYLLLPAAGPDIAYPEHYKIPLAGLSPITNTYLQNLGEYLKGSYVRNTYPSMHFGIILMTNYFARKYTKKYFWLCTLPLGTMLGIATLYLRQHYLIDLVGSVFIAGLSIYFSLRYFKNSKLSS
jgi:membrane-associated phospholipid phosphatase